MRIFIDSFPNYSVEVINFDKTNARTFWLCLTCLLSAIFASEFYRVSRKLSNKLRHQASIDSLTGVSNRGAVMTFLEAALVECEQEQQWLTVMMVDADDFKQVNDRFGHKIGDECLKKMAQSLEHCIRKQSDAVGRYGGEEFLVVLPSVDQTSAHRIAETIRESIALIRLEHQGKPVQVSATVGYCSQPVTEHASIEEYLSMADSALSAGKKAGANRVMGAEQSDFIAASV